MHQELSNSHVLIDRIVEGVLLALDEDMSFENANFFVEVFASFTRRKAHFDLLDFIVDPFPLVKNNRIIFIAKIFNRQSGFVATFVNRVYAVLQ